MLMAMIENIYETMNLRITETAFELHLRKIYPTRNIVSMRETETISGQDCLDVQKKTDGSVNIIGEVATDPVASWMIQSAQVASKFTLFTHHAKTFPNLVTALRNSMLRAGTFKDEKTAEEQVVQVLNFDIHLLKDFRGRRYIERITECIPVEEKNEYTFDHRKEKTLEGKLTKFMDNATIFFSKTTNRELYKYRNILEFADDSYVLVNPISDDNIREMRNNMEESDVVAFDAFLERNWGIKPPKMPSAVDNEDLELTTEEPKKEIEVKPDLAEQINDLMKDDDSDEPEEVYPTLNPNPTPRPTGPRPTSGGAGITKADMEGKVRRTVGIKRPAGEATPQAKRPTRPAAPTARPSANPEGQAKPRSSILGAFDDDDEE